MRSFTKQDHLKKNNMTNTEERMLTDFPKLYCPFIRQTFKVNREQWEKHGRALGLRTPEAYLVIDRINPDYEWVMNDPDTIAIEKLNGTNVKIFTEDGRLIAVQNRLNVIDPLQIVRGKTFLIEGVINAAELGYVEKDGEQAGEIIGPKLQGNPYKLDRHIWYPFDNAVKNLSYRSFHEHERNFDNWSSWFKDHLLSRYFTKRASKLGLEDKVMAEGVVFYNLKRKSEGKLWRAKLRRDMFDWYYSDKIEIIDYTKAGRPDAEDQEKFD